jgi:hypothetical protein
VASLGFGRASIHGVEADVPSSLGDTPALIRINVVIEARMFLFSNKDANSWFMLLPPNLSNFSA